MYQRLLDPSSMVWKVRLVLSSMSWKIYLDEFLKMNKCKGSDGEQRHINKMFHHRFEDEVGGHELLCHSCLYTCCYFIIN